MLLFTIASARSAGHNRQGPDRRTGGTDELQGRAEEEKAVLASGGELLELEVLDDIDAVSGQQDKMPREHNPELRIFLSDHVPGHVVRADGCNPTSGKPVGGARRHTRPGQI